MFVYFSFVLFRLSRCLFIWCFVYILLLSFITLNINVYLVFSPSDKYVWAIRSILVLSFTFHEGACSLFYGLWQWLYIYTYLLSMCRI